MNPAPTQPEARAAQAVVHSAEHAATATPSAAATDWLGVINAVIPYAANGRARLIQLHDLDQALKDSGLDSLDSAVLGAYLCELFEVPLALQRDFYPLTPREAIDFLQQHAQRHIHTPGQIHALLGTSEATPT